MQEERKGKARHEARRHGQGDWGGVVEEGDGRIRRAQPKEEEEEGLG